MPATDPACARYGGRTTCFSLETDRGLLIIDAGSGIVALGKALSQRATRRDITILLTHFHMDHLLGLPFFLPLFDPSASIRIMSDSQQLSGWQRHLRTYVGQPFFPVELDSVPSALELTNLPQNPSRLDIYGVSVTWSPVRHPQPCLAYRLETAAQSVSIVTDHEPGDPAIDERIEAFCRGSDVLLADAQYTPAEIEAYRGWGHGTWKDALDLAMKSGVSQLVLTHHDPARTDLELDAIVEEARRVFPETVAAAEGMVLPGAVTV